MALGTINSGKYRYQVERKVGAGSFGQVFLAQRSVDGNVHTDNAALKFSKRHDEEDLAHEAGLLRWPASYVPGRKAGTLASERAILPTFT